MGKRVWDAKVNIDNEWYTSYETVDRLIKPLANNIYNKVIYCPCDYYAESNFVKYFIDNFDELKLNKLIATNYANELSGGKAYKFIKTKENELIMPLDGDGDFRSRECIELMENCDVVITNPPFSFLREFLKLINIKNKEFILISPVTFFGTVLSYKMYNDERIYITEHNKSIDFGGKTVNCNFITSFPQKENDENYYTNEKVNYTWLKIYNAVNIDRLAELPKYWYCPYIVAVPVTYIGSRYCNRKHWDVIRVVDGIFENGKRVFRRILLWSREVMNDEGNVVRRGAVYEESYMVRKAPNTAREGSDDIRVPLWE